jgi:broad specificity phosphatase PhoE
LEFITLSAGLWSDHTEINISVNSNFCANNTDNCIDSWLYYVLPAQKSGVDYICAYLHYRTNRLKISKRPKRIFLIRHGESQGNEDKDIYETIPDNAIALTARGRLQALEAGENLKQIIGDETVLFYVSPFLRSQQTFELLSRAFQGSQIKVREDPRIREQEWGNFQDPSCMASVLEQREKVGRFFYRFKDGESGADVFDRVSSFMESLFREMNNDSPAHNICIVSHGLFMRLFLMRFFRWTVEQFTVLWNFDNCEVCILAREETYGSYQLKTKLKVNPRYKPQKHASLRLLEHKILNHNADFEAKQSILPTINAEGGANNARVPGISMKPDAAPTNNNISRDNGILLQKMAKVGQNNDKWKGEEASTPKHDSSAEILRPTRPSEAHNAEEADELRRPSRRDSPEKLNKIRSLRAQEPDDIVALGLGATQKSVEGGKLGQESGHERISSHDCPDAITPEQLMGNVAHEETDAFSPRLDNPYELIEKAEKCFIRSAAATIAAYSTIDHSSDTNNSKNHSNNLEIKSVAKEKHSNNHSLTRCHTAPEAALLEHTSSSPTEPSSGSSSVAASPLRLPLIPLTPLTNSFHMEFKLSEASTTTHSSPHKPQRLVALHSTEVSSEITNFQHEKGCVDTCPTSELFQKRVLSAQFESEIMPIDATVAGD